MEKVKLSKEVFEAIDSLYKDGGLFLELEYTASKFAKKSWVHKHYIALNSIDFKTFLDCAYYGYELEKNPEELIS